MPTKIRLSLLFFLLTTGLIAQQQDSSHVFSLKEAVAFGLERNYTAINAQKDIAIALKQKWEILAQGLPQLRANGDYQQYLKQPVTLIPAELSGGEPGTFTPVFFGTRHNLNATATWEQLIFDGSYIIGLQSAKALLQISKNAGTKTAQEVKKAIINAYGNVLVAQESVTILEKNVQTLENIFQETRKIFENGLAEQEDVEQLEITLLGLENNLNRSRRMREIAYQILNLSLGIPVEDPVRLSEDLEDLTMESHDLALLEKEIPVEENIDFRIAQNTAESAKIQMKLEKAKALPTINAFLNYGIQGFSQEFTFFDRDQQYFGQSILGVSLHVPLLSSGQRSARTQQKRIAYEQALVDLEQTRNQVQRQINTARTEYQFSLENYQNQKKNLELAERIENKNQVKFFEGVGSSFELSEAQRQLYTAQQDLLQAMLEVIGARAVLESHLDTTSFNDEN